MATIFPLNPQVGDEFGRYTWNGTAWKIIGVDLTYDYAEVTNGLISESVIPLTISRVDDLNSSLDGYISILEKGEPLGVAELDANGKVPSSQIEVNLSGYATETYVGTAISNLIDAAPTSLDTLNELSAALGDDENFASTVTTALGTKAPISSPTFTGTVDIPTLNLTNALGYEYGGTGMSSIGSANSILTVNPTGTALQYTSSPTFNTVTFGEAIIKTTSTELVSSIETTIGTFPVPSGNCIAIECVVLISSTSNGSYTASKLLITADPDLNSVADITEYAIMKNNDYDLFPIFTATLNGSNVLLKVLAANASNATAKVISTSILSPHGAA